MLLPYDQLTNNYQAKIQMVRYLPYPGLCIYTRIYLNTPLLLQHQWNQKLFQCLQLLLKYCLSASRRSRRPQLLTHSCRRWFPTTVQSDLDRSRQRSSNFLLSEIFIVRSGRLYSFWRTCDCSINFSKMSFSSEISEEIGTHFLAVQDSLWLLLQIDFAEPTDGKCFLLLVDAYSKWFEFFWRNHSKITAHLQQIRSPRAFSSWQ